VRSRHQITPFFVTSWHESLFIRINMRETFVRGVWSTLFVPNSSCAAGAAFLFSPNICEFPFGHIHACHRWSPYNLYFLFYKELRMCVWNLYIKCILIFRLILHLLSSYMKQVNIAKKGCCCRVCIRQINVTENGKSAREFAKASKEILSWFYSYSIVTTSP